MRKLLVLAALVVLCSGVAMAQDHPKAEIFGGYSYLRANPSGSGAQGDNIPGGWHASVAGNLNSWFGVAADFSGHYGRPDFGLGVGIKTHVHTFTFGPRLSYRKSEKFTPYAHALFGGAHANAGAFGVSGSQNAFAVALGGGVDVKINDLFAIRVGQADYLLTRFDIPGIDRNQHNFRFSTGIVIRVK